MNFALTKRKQDPNSETTLFGDKITHIVYNQKHDEIYVYKRIPCLQKKFIIQFISLIITG